MTDSDASVRRFYDGLADDYHLVYGGGWEAAIDRQAAALDALIRSQLPAARDVLDCSCGIGTQALGLARLGYRVTGTDVSGGAVERATREARRLGLEVSFALADFRDLRGVPGEFDVLISCDNALPHLLDPDDVARALAEMRSRLRAGGLLVVTMRDFDRALAERRPFASPADSSGQPRRVLVRLYDWDDGAPSYTVRYLVLTEETSGWTAEEHTTRCRAITREELTTSAEKAGFTQIDWPADREIVGGGQWVMTARAG